MTERRTTPDPAAEHDPVVRETYRDVATERAPDHLNRAVLDTAAREVRPRYWKMRSWTRPAAWAAVVMLSVAILMESNQEPALEVMAPRADKQSADDTAADQPGADSLAKDSDAAETAEAEAAAEVAERKLESQLTKSEPPPAAAQQPSVASELRVRDDAMLERAADMARMQQGREESAAGCDDRARAEPEAWLSCIIELEQAGLFEVARTERELLAETFPDFDAR